MELNPGLKTLTKKPILLLLIFIIASAAFGIWYENSAKNNVKSYVFTPQVSTGCNRLVWENTKVHLSASTNLGSPRFTWSMENITIGTERNLVYTFKPGRNNILLKAEAGNYSVKGTVQIIVVNSTEDLSAYASEGSMSNERVFFTRYKGTEYYIDGVSVTADGKDRGTIPECRELAVSGLLPGSHTWKAAYHGNDIGSGSFVLEAVSGMRISGIDIVASYHAGDTVDGKIFLQNTGTIPIKHYSIKTLVVNHNFEWMGNIAKKEFVSDFDSDVVPGDKVNLPVSVKIPEKVSGIRPAGDYSITVQLIINGNVEDTRTVNTVVV